MSKREAEENAAHQEKKPKFDESPENSSEESPEEDEESSTAVRYITPGGHGLSPPLDKDKVLANEESIQNFIEEKSLREGDLVNFGHYRDVETYIVFKYDDSDTLTLMPNRDISGNGYLTIPTEVLKNIKNFYDKYKSILEERNLVIFCPEGSDEFLQGHLGKIPAEGWEFSVHFTLGELEQFSVRPDRATASFQNFNLEDTTWEEIEEFFKSREGGVETFKVRVTLEGEAFENYKSQFSPNKGRREWMKAKPNLPVGWTCERGMSGGGSKNFNWVWSFSGPTATKPTMKANVETFLGDFSHEYMSL